MLEQGFVSGFFAISVSDAMNAERDLSLLDLYIIDQVVSDRFYEAVFVGNLIVIGFDEVINVFGIRLFCHHVRFRPSAAADNYRSFIFPSGYWVVNVGENVSRRSLGERTVFLQHGLRKPYRCIFALNGGNNEQFIGPFKESITDPKSFRVLNLSARLSLRVNHLRISGKCA